ncbi:MAG: DUF6768 family protein [Sphingomonadales bacterium]
MAIKEQTLFQMVGDVFKGPLKGWTILLMIFGVVITGFFIYSLWQFMGAVSVTDHLHWLLGVILAGLGIVLMKIWFWLLMMRNSILRALEK